MARHHHRHHHHRHHRRNPFGISTEVVKDAAFTTAGALAAPYLGSLLQQTGWMDVGATAVAGVALMYGGRAVVGQGPSEELLKGALVATIIKALKQAGYAGNLGLGMYINTTFPLPTASDAYGRIPLAPMVGAPATALTPTGAGAPGTLLAPKALGAYNRFRTRYGGRF
jgi:hypothetical protein